MGTVTYSNSIVTTTGCGSNPLQGKSAVICEDEALIIMQIKCALVRAGVNVVGIATNGIEAVDVVLRERPDLVLMDIRMPMQDGLEATEKILKSFDTCIVMLTAFAGTPMVERALELGAFGYLVKPVDGTHIIPAVWSAVNLSNARQAKVERV